MELQKKFKPFPKPNVTVCENCGVTLTDENGRAKSGIFADGGIWCEKCWNDFGDNRELEAINS